jgi:hypothetical protein
MFKYGLGATVYVLNDRRITRGVIQARTYDNEAKSYYVRCGRRTLLRKENEIFGRGE